MSQRFSGYANEEGAYARRQAGAGGYDGLTEDEALRGLAMQVEPLLSRASNDCLQLRRSLGEKTPRSSQVSAGSD